MTKTANVAGSNLSRLISLSTVIFALPSADAFYHSSPLLVRQRNVVQQQRHHDSIAGIMIDPNLSSTAKSSSLNLSLLRGGATVAAATTAVTSSTTVSSILLKLASDSSSLFNSCLLGLALTTAVASSVGKVGLLSSKKSVAKVDADDVVTKKPASVRSLQIRFLAVFWLLRCADWLQGPYFYEVYASKVLSNGLTTSTTLIGRLFLAGFASTGTSTSTMYENNNNNNNTDTSTRIIPIHWFLILTLENIQKVVNVLKFIKVDLTCCRIIFSLPILIL